MGRGLLVAAFDFSTAHIDEFHDWYDLERDYPGCQRAISGDAGNWHDSDESQCRERVRCWWSVV